MGRLTLNVLLSFAQFEREVTGERIRDKIAASKRKGMWMGGPVALGYEVVDRKLVVNQVEAQTVRHIMRSYLDLGSIALLVERLKCEGLRTKTKQLRTGQVSGGVPYCKGGLAHLLRNCVYVGEVRHGAARYPGEHDAIVDRLNPPSILRYIRTGPSGLRHGLPNDIGGPVRPSACGRSFPSGPLRQAQDRIVIAVASPAH